jgi:predicted lysophospholipase L1 biosynthesis ABC-type transport system permease subunit
LPSSCRARHDNPWFDHDRLLVGSVSAHPSTPSAALEVRPECILIHQVFPRERQSFHNGSRLVLGLRVDQEDYTLTIAALISSLAKLDNRPTDVQLADGGAGLQSSSKLAKPASILLAVSLVVLLIACANLATLLLSRTSARSSEFALRLAIGSSRRRILAQVLVESALLAVFGTAAGIAVAYAIERILLSFLNRTTPQIHQLHIALDGTVLVFVAVTSAICVLLFGAAPALQAARTAALGSSAGNTRAGAAIRKAFVVAQIALSFIVVLQLDYLSEHCAT